MRRFAEVTSAFVLERPEFTLANEAIDSFCKKTNWGESFLDFLYLSIYRTYRVLEIVLQFSHAEMIV